MFYIKTFNNEQEYINYMAGPHLLPNISLAKDTQKTFITPYSNEAGDIVLHDGKKYYTTKPQNLQTLYSTGFYTIEGIVVVPNTHTPDGTTRFISLVSMDYNNPEHGNANADVGIIWGGYNPTQYDIPELVNYTSVPTTTNEIGTTTVGSSNVGYLPSDYLTGLQSVVDNKAKYYYNGTTHTGETPFIPSMYNNDGTPNLAARVGATGDLDGKGNTDKILLHYTAEDWRTVSKITNSQNNGYYPAAACCKRYKTTNTQDWYLPSCGELSYLSARFNKISQSMANVIAVLGNSNARQIPVSWFWSSSECSGAYARYVLLYNGLVYYYIKGYSLDVRAFASAAVQFGI